MINSRIFKTVFVYLRTHLVRIIIVVEILAIVGLIIGISKVGYAHNLVSDSLPVTESVSSEADTVLDPAPSSSDSTSTKITKASPRGSAESKTTAPAASSEPSTGASTGSSNPESTATPTPNTNDTNTSTPTPTPTPTHTPTPTPTPTSTPTPTPTPAPTPTTSIVTAQVYWYTAEGRQYPGQQKIVQIINRANGSVLAQGETNDQGYWSGANIAANTEIEVRTDGASSQLNTGSLGTMQNVTLNIH